jgi:TrmH family RNA methyltransferase
VPILLDQIRIVLVNTSHPGNIGSAARAMKTMGLNHLYLVAPQQFPHPKADEMASHAIDVVANAQTAPTLREAIADCTWVIGCSARSRRVPWPLLTPRVMAEQVKQALMITSDRSAEEKAPIAIVFGREQSGLTNEELEQCHVHVCIPANPAYSSLNLAAAVQVIAYELRLASLETDTIETEWREHPLANAAEMALFFTHLQTVLIELDFLKLTAPRKLMTRLRRLFFRSKPDTIEMNILRGILTAIQENRNKKEQ